MQDCWMMKLSMRSTDEKHQNKGLKSTTQYDLGQNTNTTSTKLPLSLSKVIKSIMLEAMKKC